MSIDKIKPQFPFEGSILGNGSSVPVLEHDVLPEFPLLKLGKLQSPSDFKVNAPNVKIDPGIIKIVSKMSEALAKKGLNYREKLRSWKLNEILMTDDSKTNAKAKLTRDGYNAVIGEVSNKINKSSTDHSLKYLLSHEPLYVYALSYAIYKEKVKDADGIFDRVIIVTEREIKPYLNKLLTREVIKQKHLQLNIEQKKKIYKEAEGSNISYLKGIPVNAVQKIITKFLSHGNLHALVDEFFKSGGIDPAKGTPQVRQLMVKYLVEIGLKLQDSDIDRIQDKAKKNRGEDYDFDDTYEGQIEEDIDESQDDGFEEESGRDVSNRYGSAGEEQDSGESSKS